MRLDIAILVLQLTAIYGLVVAQTIPNNNNQHINLLQRYPTTLSKGSTKPGEAREWKFSKEDIYSLSEFSLKVGDALKVKTGSADVGIGHCVDGAVWAVVIPRKSGTLNSSVSAESESIDHFWLRFHPSEIITLFPESTVKILVDEGPWMRMLKIANTKIQGSWQAGGRAMIPGRKDLTVDADTKGGKRRFFVVDTEAATARYISAFENRIVPEDKPFSKDLAESSFDQLWEEYDREYAMFTLRPEINWEKLREQYRPEALECKTAYELAHVCAEMLKHLRDLHIWVKVDGQNIPVFNRPRERNANPSAFEAIIGKLNKAGEYITWSKAAEKVGFIVINSWRDDVDEKFDEVLENMRDTRGLIIDVRLNGGGSEPMAGNVAGRFVDKEYIYAYSQFRNGPNHADLTEKYPRKIEPRGPWRYDRPVVLLMGQKCMSSNESFVSMMAQCPNVTTMGDRTCGSSGNPKFLNLQGNIRISLPRWIDLLPDGTPLEERGIMPDVNFPTERELFEGKRDDLLQAAVTKLSEQPLPDKPITGPSILNRPQVVSVFPADGDKNVDPNCEIKIRFDRRMNPWMTNLRWDTGEYKNFRYLEYDANSYEFRMAFILKANSKHQIRINAEDMRQFRDTEGNASQKYKWNFKTRASSHPVSDSRPNLISIKPVTGSVCPTISEFHLKFDQPMQPYQYRFQLNFSRWSYRYGIILTAVKCTPDKTESIIPLILPPMWEGDVEFSELWGQNGLKADTVILNYKTSQELLGSEIRKRINKSKTDTTLRSLIVKMNDARDNLKSVSEDVHTIYLFSPQRFSTDTAHFKMQGDRQFLAKKALSFDDKWCVGSDGKNIWRYYKDLSQESLTICTFSDIDERSIMIAEPFAPIERSLGDVITKRENNPNVIIEKMNLEHLGTDIFNHRKCHMIRSWSGEFWTRGKGTSCSVRTWWIDSDTLLPVKVLQDTGHAVIMRQFNYHNINHPIDISEFQSESYTTIRPKSLVPLLREFDTRIVKVKDGSQGHLTIWWGEKGLDNISGLGIH